MVRHKAKVRALKRRARRLGRPLKVVAWEMLESGDYTWSQAAKDWLISKGYSRKIFAFALGQ